MNYLFEAGDLINMPVQCFYYNSEQEDFPVRPHWHYYMEIIYMISGCAEMHDGSSVYTLSPGEMILFHPKAVHSIYSADGLPVRYAVFKLDISRMSVTANYAPKLRSIFRHAEKLYMNIVFSKKNTEDIHAAEIFDRCIEETNVQKYGYDLIIRTQIYRLLIDILRIWQDDGFVISSEVFADDDRYDVYNITEYIDANMNRGMKISEVAQMCGMSYSNFAKRFLAVYGKTCKQYIEEMRIYKAEEFLIFTDFDLTYISQETGFSDCSHLIKSFKNIMGITPKQYRLQYSRRGTMPEARPAID